MHICFITHEYPKVGFPHGGIGSFVKTIARALIQNNMQVSVVGINYTATNEKEIDGGVTIYRLKKSTIRGLAWYYNSKAINKKIREIHSKFFIDIIESNEAGLALVNKITGIEYVVRMHGGHQFFTLFENRPREKRKVWLENQSFKKADHLVAVSEYVAQITLRELSLQGKKVMVIYNPVDTQKFKQVDYTKATTNSILFVGSVCEKKGIRQLVQALALAKKQMPDVTLKIVGRDWFFSNGSSYMDYLNNYISDEIKDSVSIIGAVSNAEIPEFIEQSEICVYPSHMEAMPLAWLEVLSMGKQLIASAIGPGFEAIKDKKTGLLCDPHNPEDIAAKIIWMLEHKVEAQQMGMEARKDILERFDIKVLVQKNIQFYESLIVK